MTQEGHDLAMRGFEVAFRVLRRRHEKTFADPNAFGSAWRELREADRERVRLYVRALAALRREEGKSVLP